MARPRVVVMTDIANEPDDQMSLVRFLVYANQLDVEGLIATTSTWMKARVRPDVIHSVLDAYEKATTEGDRRGAVMFGDEMIDEASRKMALKFVSRGERAGMTRS